MDDAPVEGLFAAVVGQAAAVTSLRAAARHPVHAYLLTGPPGSGVRPAALAFGAVFAARTGGAARVRSAPRHSPFYFFNSFLSTTRTDNQLSFI